MCMLEVSCAGVQSLTKRSVGLTRTLTRCDTSTENGPRVRDAPECPIRHGLIPSVILPSIICIGRKNHKKQGDETRHARGQDKSENRAQRCCIMPELGQKKVRGVIPPFPFPRP